MKFKIGLLIGLSAISAFGVEVTPSLLKKYYKGNFTFDGTRVSSSDASTSIDNPKRSAGQTNGNTQYKMTWDRETIGNDSVLTMTESSVTDNSKKSAAMISARTTSFFNNGLRSTTNCYGSKSSSTDLRCVTASRQACDSLLNAYISESEKNGNGLSTKAGTGFKDTAKKAAECTDLLGSYAKLAKAFANGENHGDSNTKEVINGDVARIKKHLAIKDVKVTSLEPSPSGDKLYDFAEAFTDSIPGLQALNSAITTCVESNNDFAKPTTKSQTTEDKIKRIDNTK